ncbi:collagen-like protein [Allomuricauda sp. SCSIO 65647]|uniref:collagen-like protein n=1 Tax=Allomuricauda sp. SCSIO 65647 TaxID=2908843 RepID=UPI001F1BA2B9|nr:collagen-like protein [Muricauda sp. SCSIO 65647]UJH66910.1 collagen-like protein [Muricauda sp. SCSIO 65647]
MSSIKTIFGIILALLVISCEGPQGPPGFDGRDGIDGQDGVNILGQVLEIQGTFSAENNYSILYEFPQNVEVFEADVVLVYLLFDQTEDSNGELVDIWRLLPQTRILDQGLLQYNYDHTFLDVNIFLEADFDLTTLLPGDTDNQVFRIAVVPAEFASDPSLDLSNLESVMGRMEISSNEIQQIELD